MWVLHFLLRYHAAMSYSEPYDIWRMKSSENGYGLDENDDEEMGFMYGNI